MVMTQNSAVNGFVNQTIFYPVKLKRLIADWWRQISGAPNVTGVTIRARNRFIVDMAI